MLAKFDNHPRARQPEAERGEYETSFTLDCDSLYRHISGSGEKGPSREMVSDQVVPGAGGPDRANVAG